MSVAITLLDKTTDGKHYQESELRLVSQRTTLREILQKRIQQEVDKHNSGNKQLFFGLIQPSNTERKLNGYKMRKPRTVSYERQLNLAVEAFNTAGFFVLLDDRQIEDLDTAITLRDDSQLSFIKLIPLVGG